MKWLNKQPKTRENFLGYKFALLSIFVLDSRDER